MRNLSRKRAIEQALREGAYTLGEPIEEGLDHQENWKYAECPHCNEGPEGWHDLHLWVCVCGLVWEARATDSLRGDPSDDSYPAGWVICPILDKDGNHIKG